MVDTFTTGVVYLLESLSVLSNDETSVEDHRPVRIRSGTSSRSLHVNEQEPCPFQTSHCQDTLRSIA